MSNHIHITRDHDKGEATIEVREAQQFVGGTATIAGMSLPIAYGAWSLPRARAKVDLLTGKEMPLGIYVVE